MAEGRKLQRISRTAKDPVKLRRAIVVLMSAQGQTVKDITTLMQVGEDYVREVIHAFNEQGFDALDTNTPGRRRTSCGCIRATATTPSPSTGWCTRAGTTSTAASEHGLHEQRVGLFRLDGRVGGHGRGSLTAGALSVLSSLPCTMRGWTR